MDVDCSRITYDTPPSASILSAVERAKMAGVSPASEPLGEYLQNIQFLHLTFISGRTETMQESLSNSLLRQMDPNQASEAELREAFCRDIDAYSFEFEPQQVK